MFLNDYRPERLKHLQNRHIGIRFNPEIVEFQKEEKNNNNNNNRP